MILTDLMYPAHSMGVSSCKEGAIVSFLEDDEEYGSLVLSQESVCRLTAYLQEILTAEGPEEDDESEEEISHGT